jgi:hypothetical protein
MTSQDGARPALSNCCVVLCIDCFVSFYVLLMCKCVVYFCHRVTSQLQLTNISYHIVSYHTISYHNDSLSQTPDNNPYYIHLPWNIVHWVFSNNISYLSIRDQCDCDSSHQQIYIHKYTNVSVRKHHNLKTRFFGVEYVTTITITSTIIILI